MGHPHPRAKFRLPLRISGNCKAGRHYGCYSINCICPCNHTPGPRVHGEHGKWLPQYKVPKVPDEILDK